MEKLFIIDSIYFSVNNLLSSQFGFRSGASTEHALLIFSVDILKLFDQKKGAIAHAWISVKRLTMCMDIKFYYPNSNDMAYNGSISNDMAMDQ